MKKIYLFSYCLLLSVAAFGQNVNYTIEVVQFQMNNCDDGPGSDEEPTWKAWARDNNTTNAPLNNWTGGTCHFVDGNIPFGYIPSSTDVLINTTNSDATVLDFRFDAWEDDCDPGGNRCDFNGSCFPSSADDDRAQPQVLGINFRDSTACEWHEVTASSSCFAWFVRFKWEYTDFNGGALVQDACGDSIVLSAAGSGQWSIVSGGTGGFTDNQDPATTFGGVQGNTYVLQWTTLPGCMTANSEDIQIDLNSLPVPNLSANTSLFCEYGSIDLTAADGNTYDWSLNTIGNVVETNSTGNYTHTGLSLTDSKIYVTVTDATTSCVGLDSLEFTVNASPVVDLGVDTTICFGVPYLLDPGNQPPLTAFSWNVGGTSQQLSATAAGQYIVTATFPPPTACSNSDTVDILFYNEIITNLSASETMCIGDSVIADAGTGFVSYEWDDLSTGSTNTYFNFGTYYVTVTDGNDCEATDSIVVSPTYFNYSLGADTTISLGATIDITANPGVDYSWTTGDTTQTISVTPSQDETFISTTELANGCFEVGTINVFVDENLNIFIPNMFSPNGDQNNDEFLLYGFGIQEVEFKIYNRWGQLVYETSDIVELQTTGWDGMFNNQEQPTGTYVWTLTGTTVNGDAVSFEGENKGTLLLRR